jgi:hypothetical protein
MLQQQQLNYNEEQCFLRGPCLELITRTINESKAVQGSEELGGELVISQRTAVQ